MKLKQKEKPRFYRRWPVFAAGILILLQGTIHLFIFPTILFLNLREESLTLIDILNSLYWKDLGILSAITQATNGELVIQLANRMINIPLEQIYSALFIPFSVLAVPVTFAIWIRYRHAWILALLQQVLILTLCIYLYFNHLSEYLYLVMAVSVFEVVYLNLYDLRLVFDQT